MNSAIRTWLSVALCAASLPAAAAQRTFVASYGNDALPCTRAEPCRSFATALTNTDAYGEVVVLDSAGYGRVTIDRSVTLAAPAGVYAGISVFGGANGIDIGVPGASVVLRGLSINGQGGNTGIRVTQALRVTVDGCTIANLGLGIAVIGAAIHLHVSDSTIRNNAGDGLVVAGASSAAIDRVTSERNGGSGMNFLEGASASIARSRIADNAADGIKNWTLNAGESAVLSVSDSAVSGNAVIGVFARAVVAASSVSVSVTRSTLAHNGSGAVYAEAVPGSVAIVSVRDSTASHNGTGLGSGGAGARLSFGATTIAGNRNEGVFQQDSGTLLSLRTSMVHDNNGGGAQFTGSITPLAPL